MHKNHCHEIESLRKKLSHRSHNRGSKETDIIFLRFAQNHLNDLNHEQLLQYETILNAEDVLIMDLLFKRKELPNNLDADLLEKLLAFNVK